MLYTSVIMTVCMTPSQLLDISVFGAGDTEGHCNKQRSTKWRIAILLQRSKWLIIVDTVMMTILLFAVFGFLLTFSWCTDFKSVPTTVKTYENDTVLLPCYLDSAGGIYSFKSNLDLFKSSQGLSKHVSAQFGKQLH